MPTYEYACKTCEERLEVQQRFTDDPLTECPACGGPLRKVFSAVGIAFKGSGFYKTDSRGGSSASKTPTSTDKPATPSTTSDSSSSSSSTSDSSSSGSSSSGSSTPSTSSPAAS